MQPAGTSGKLLGVDAVREFNVATGVYGAEYGKRPGAQVSIITDSGTNQWHGTVFEFLRNSALDARNFFDYGAKPSFQRNLFGGALGGPIILGSPNEYFNLAAFMVPPDGTYGNVGRDTLTVPGLGELDLSILQDTWITEKTRLELRAELFNILNRANFNTPNPIVFTQLAGAPATTAGVIASTSTGARQIQFGVKIVW